MYISKKAIIKKASSPSVMRGETLFRKNKVFRIWEDLDEEAGEFYCSADVQGSHGLQYHVALSYDMRGDKFIDYQCECPAYYQYSGLCKHCVALAFYFAKEEKKVIQMELEDFLKKAKKEKKEEKFQIRTSPQMETLIYNYSMISHAKYLQPSVNGKVELEPTLHQNYQGWSVDFRIGAESKYVLKDLHAFVGAMKHREKVDYGKKLSFIHEMSAFTPEAQEMARFVEKYVGEYCHYHGAIGIERYYHLPAMRALELTEESIGAFFHLMLNRSCKWKDAMVQGTLRFLPGNPDLTFQMEELPDEAGYSLVLSAMESWYGNGHLYLLIKDCIYECDREFSEQMRYVCNLGKQKIENILHVNAKDMNSFCSTLLPVLKKHVNLKIEGDLEAYIPMEAVIKIYLDSDETMVTVRLEAEYGEDAYNLLKDFGVADAFRDIEKESYTVQTVQAYVPGVTEDYRLCIQEEDEDALYHLLSTGMPQIAQLGELYISESFKRLKVVKTPKVSVGVSLKGSLIDLQIDSGSLLPEELEGYLQSYRRKKKFYRLKSGAFVNLEENTMAVLSELTDGLHLDTAKMQEGSVQIPKYQGFYLDQVLKKDGEGVEVFRDQTFKSMIREMKSVEDSDFEVPSSLKNTMRNYQKTGFRWLCTLDHLHFGGILADDMGLGKTLQILAYLSWYQASAELRKPCLIVCPASLVYNWQSELEKFTPGLSALVVAGSMEERKQMLERCGEYDAVITSYDLLKRDVEQYREISFYAEIIDEAQNIKNQSTQAAKAVKAVSADMRFALTGTPIENRLSELWSIFDYLMPGFLGAYQSFRNEFETPIVTKKEEVITKRLQKMIKPFILRRVKKDVLKDLPEKEETIVYSKLEGEQKKVYEANVQKMLDNLKNKSQEEFQNGKLQILAELIRLRQICCAPSLVYDNYSGAAAKLDTCMELLRNAVEGGHKVLLFSQFTSIFVLLEECLKKESLEYYKLTGATTKPKRMEMVREFNENEVPVFLISLKAGGTGLNLTGASIVIHFDPWWNVAAQNQATDRAHRIGQKQAVSVFKLIAKGTIEEKIVKMQEAKKDLSDQIISEGGISVSNLTREDFMGLLDG